MLRGLAHHLVLRVGPGGDDRLLLGADEVEQVGLELIGRRKDLVRLDVPGADVQDVVDVLLLVVDRPGEDRGEGVLPGADRAEGERVTLVQQLVDDDGDRTRIQATGQARAHGHLGLQAQPHRLHEAALVLRGRGRVVGALHGGELEQLLLQPGEHATSDAVRVGFQHLARSEALDALEEGLRAVLVGAKAQVAVDRAVVDPLLVQATGQDRLDLAGEQQRLALTARVRDHGDVERLDAEVVAGQGQPLLVTVPDGEAEHAVEPVERVGAPLREGLQHDLGVRVGREGATERLELAAQVEVVVDLAVVGDRVPAVGGVHRLLAVGDVDDRQPPVRQAAGPVDADSVPVRATVLLVGVHALEQRGVGGEPVVSGDATHASGRSSRIGAGGGAHPACHGCRPCPIPSAPSGRAGASLRAGGSPARRRRPP